MAARLCRLFSALLLLHFAVAVDAGAWPDARWGHVLVYFPPQDVVILFGGASTRQEFRDDLWAWDGDSWRQLEAPTPPARGFAAAAYDPHRESILLHGGRGNDRVTFSDLWEWNGDEWQLLEADGPFQSDHHAMAYVPENGGVLIFGGWTGEKVTSETWGWDGEWRLLADGAASPPPRSAFGMTYNANRARVEVYGGLWINGQYADSWAWAAGKWQALTGPYDNSSLDHHAMFFDARSGDTLIFGGKDYRYRMRAETRRMDATGRVEVLSDSGPVSRHSSAIAWDASRSRAVLFGGKVYEGDAQIPLGDTWTWKDGHWLRHPEVDSP